MDHLEEIERLQMKIDALIHEQDELVKAVAARKMGNRSIESLYEYVALNYPTAWQLSGGNIPGQDIQTAIAKMEKPAEPWDNTG